jgi:hypothetical protein
MKLVSQQFVLDQIELCKGRLGNPAVNTSQQVVDVRSALEAFSHFIEARPVCDVVILDDDFKKI